ncbi:hypothetical protein [Noviherbaspirillum aridicola]|uniref:Lipoprotein n=1 Tax=Noviherbaspirillum aridicola TaxID=2849687 RepID=A0ABQ4PZI5_9BURK|nr:hypothetical protein [Noviherbaspirillum aridicola]GIZ50231.1 hypothetical protein NCCP691_02450 [Noviherbaspirillum aridicola]
MLAKKKIAGLLTVAALLAACGGGGGGDDNTTRPATGGTPSSGSDSGGTPTGGGDTSTPPGGGNQNPGTQQPDNGGGQQVNDTKLQGQLAIVADQLVFLKADRNYYNAIQLEEFETGGGLLDAAAGATGNETRPANDMEDGIEWIAPTVTAPAAPFASVGFRIDRFVQTTETVTSVGNQTAVGRLAFRLVELQSSPDIGTNEVPEELSFVVEGVELSTSEQGLLSARVRENSLIHVRGRTAAGNEISASFPANPQSVRLAPASQVLDNYGDETSTVLLFDLEQAFAQAADRLPGIELLSGQFAMALTLSAADLIRPASAGLQRDELDGESITVGSQPAVTGDGISGTAWIRAYPRNPS